MDVPLEEKVSRADGAWRLSDWSLWLVWVLANGLGELLGLFAERFFNGPVVNWIGYIAYPGSDVGLNPLRGSDPVWLIGAILYTTVIGIAQWLVVHHYIRTITWWEWTL